MHVEIIKPEDSVYKGEATSVVMPGLDGSFGILDHHAPMITTLKKGVIEVTTNTGEELTFEVNGGTVEVLNNTLTVLAE